MFFLFHGENQAASRKSLTSLTEKYSSEVSVFEVGSLEVRDLKNTAETKPMFNEKRLVVVEGKPPREVLKKLKESLTDIPDHTDVVFWSSEQLRKSSGLHKFVKKSGGKVKQFKATSKEEIFPFLDAVSARSKKKTLKEGTLLIKREVDPVYILTMLVWQVRNLLYVHFESAQKEKMHPFVLKKTRAKVKNFEEEELLRLFKQLSDYDVKIKSGALPKKLAFEKLLIELCL